MYNIGAIWAPDTDPPFLANPIWAPPQKKLRDVQQRAKGNKFLQVKASFTGFEQTVTVGGIK